MREREVGERRQRGKVGKRRDGREKTGGREVEQIKKGEKDN